MKLGDFLKTALEEKFLGKRIKNWNNTNSFIVDHIEVMDGGVDPQWEIRFYSELNRKMTDEMGEWQRINNPTGGVLTPKELTERCKTAYIESFTMNLVDDVMPEIVETSPIIGQENLYIMKTWIVDIETRKNDRDTTLGPFTTFEKAQDAMREYLRMSIDELLERDAECDFGSDYNKGLYYSEEETVEIIERELK